MACSWPWIFALTLATGGAFARQEQLAPERLLRERLETLERREPDAASAAGYEQLFAECRASGPHAMAHEIAHRILDRYGALAHDVHQALLQNCLIFAAAESNAGRREQALRLFKRLLPILQGHLGEGHKAVIDTRRNLGTTLHALGKSRAAGDQFAEVLRLLEATLPDKSPQILRARRELARSLAQQGELGQALALQESVLAVWEAAAPQDDLRLANIRKEVADTLFLLRRLDQARELLETVIAARQAQLPPHDLGIVDARSDLAAVLHSLGQIEPALELQQQIVVEYETYHREQVNRLLTARMNLGVMLYGVGQAARALMLLRDVVAAQDATWPEDHPDVLLARTHLAEALRLVGDYPGALLVAKDVLRRQQALLPADHHDVLATQAGVAGVMALVGQLEQARSLQAELVSRFEALRPPGHVDRLNAKEQLASTLTQMDRLQEATQLLTEVVEARADRLPSNDADLIRSRALLGSLASALGEHDRARELFEQALSGFEDSTIEHPRFHLFLLIDFAWVCARMGDSERLRELLSGLDADLRTELATAALRSRRAAAESILSLSGMLAIYLSTGPSVDIPASRMFTLLETMRAVRSAPTLTPAAVDQVDRSAAVNAVRKARRMVRQALTGVAADAQEDRSRIASATLALDKAEEQLRSELREAGGEPTGVDVEDVLRVLAPGSAVVGYWRYTRLALHEQDPQQQVPVESLLAHIVRPDGGVVRVELGPIREIETAVRDWRARIGAPVRRGVAAGVSADKELRLSGVALRKLILDPVLHAVGDARRLHVCVDDVLNLVPLDALPISDGAGGGVVGDKIRILNEESLLRFTYPWADPQGALALVVFGGIDYDAESEDDPGPAAVSPESGAPTFAVRAGSGQVFPRLPETKYEVENIANYFERMFELPPVERSGDQATKAAFRRLAPRARFLHVATHGYFADDSVLSRADQGLDPGARYPSQEVIRGVAPMTLCGLALAGANRDGAESGFAPGIMTAAEIMDLDLTNCELAVLSACETNVGIRRAGQGIQSLRTALHAAGVRSSITSLWRVGDEWSRALMEGFYQRLWVQKKSKADALWETKLQLRAAGAGVKDWAGWVLTGDHG